MKALMIFNLALDFSIVTGYSANLFFKNML